MTGTVLRTGDKVTSDKSLISRKPYLNVKIAAMYVSHKILNVDLVFHPLKQR